MKENRHPTNYYLFAIGIGFAYGLIGAGFLTTKWYYEAVSIALILSIASVVFKFWVFDAYLSECKRIEQPPKIFLFIFIQAFANCSRIFVSAILIIGIKTAFGVEHINGRIWLVKNNPISNRYECIRFKETPETLFKSVSSEKGPGCQITNRDDRYQINCNEKESMVFFTSESSCLKYTN